MTRSLFDAVRVETFFILLALLLAYGTYQTLGIALHTQSPLVSVTSNSMHHEPSARTCIDEQPGLDGFNQFWHGCGHTYGTYNISRSMFQTFPLAHGFERGDILIVKGVPFEDIQVGDVVVYHVQGKNIPIVHRVVTKHNNTLETKGDSNTAQNRYEDNVTPEQVQGVAVGVIPKVGLVKIIPYNVFCTGLNLCG